MAARENEQEWRSVGSRVPRVTPEDLDKLYGCPGNFPAPRVYPGLAFTGVERAVSTPASVLPPKTLSAAQQHILCEVLAGHSVFITGPGGAGKSHLLKEIIKAVISKYRKESIGVTAPTAIAACQVGGVTLHSWAGVGLWKGDSVATISLAVSNGAAKSRWLQCRILVIDEVSMLDCDLFDCLDQIGQQTRKNSNPFGGVQLVVCGDFSQLPPVTKGRNSRPRYAFFARAWHHAVPAHFLLKTVYRQSDTGFIQLLARVRTGTLTAADIQILRGLSRPLVCPEGLRPAELYPKRRDVDSSNTGHLARLPGDTTYVYKAEDSGDATLLRDLAAPSNLELAVGAQVVFLRNKCKTLINGRLGIVIAMEDSSTWEGRPSMRVHTDRGWKALLPVVRFVVPGGGDEVVDIMVHPENFDVEDASHSLLARRTQLPLMLAWALSIHRSQGQTLDRVRVDLRNVFEFGQAYVAMSRARALEGLQIVNFEPVRIKVSEDVSRWYAQVRWAELPDD